VRPAALLRWLEESEAMASRYGGPPQLIGGGFKRKPRGLQDHKYYPIDRYRSRFVEQVRASNVKYLDTQRMELEWGSGASDWEFDGTFGLCATTCGRCYSIYSIGVAVSVLQAGPMADPRDFCAQCLAEARGLMGPCYGLAVIMPKAFLPGGYVIGLGGEGPDELAMDATAWMDLACECPRRLRNVFGYNILGAPHLDIRVGEMRLADWIRASKDRGRIEDLGGGLFLWTFQDGAEGGEFLQWNHPPVVAVREELKRHKVFLWQRE